MDELKWVKATASNSSGNCVQLSTIGDGIVMRDSKDPQGPMLRFTRAEIEAFFAGVRAGEFDFVLSDGAALVASQ